MINKIEKYVKKGDYLYAVVRGHPLATDKGYVLAHRAIMENHIGRYLTKSEVIHHVNGNKKDNRVENLEIHTQSSHGKLHKKPRKWIRFSCPGCGKLVEKLHNKSHICNGGNASFCSRRCAGFRGIIRVNSILEIFYK